MGKIKVTSCEVEGKVIEGLYVIEPTVFKDERGYFMETYNQNDFKEAGLDMVFVQDNQSMSVKGVLRGLHFQKQFPQDTNSYQQHLIRLNLPDWGDFNSVPQQSSLQITRSWGGDASFSVFKIVPCTK